MVIGVTFLIFTAISMIFSYIRANMFFVFMESLIDRNVSIRHSFLSNKNKGFSLFLFNLLTNIFFFILIIIIFIPLILHVWHIIDNPKANFAIWSIIPNFILSFVVFFVLIIIASLVYSLTYDFACPVAYARDKSIIGSFFFLVRLIINYPFQFFMYYILKIAFSIIIGIGTFILVIPLLLVLAIIYIPLILIACAIVAGIVFLFMKNLTLGIIAGIIGLLLIFLIIMAISYLFIVPFIPVYGFFRFYALCFLEFFPEVGLNFSEVYPKVIKS